MITASVMKGLSLKIIFDLTCNFTTNELFQYDIVFKTVERLKIRVKTLIFINVKVFKKNALNFYTVVFFLLFPKTCGQRGTGVVLEFF